MTRESRPATPPARKRIRLPLGDYRSPGAWYFVTICCHQKIPLLKSPRRRRLVREILVQFAFRQKVELACYTVLPDHLHFSASAGRQGLIGFIRDFKSAATRELRHGGIQGPVWQRSFFDRRLRSDDSLVQKCQYVWLNPVRRHLVNEPDQYRWSGALLGGQHYVRGRP